MPQLQTTVPGDESPAGTCTYCGQPFPISERLVLHKGVAHYDQLDDSEQEAFRSVYTNENDELRTLRLRALGFLVLLYFGFLFLYAIFA